MHFLRIKEKNNKTGLDLCLLKFVEADNTRLLFLPPILLLFDASLSFVVDLRSTAD